MSKVNKSGSFALPSDNSKIVVEYKGTTPEQKNENSQLIQTSESMMKFGFMAMSMTYLSSINIMKALQNNGTSNSSIKDVNLTSTPSNLYKPSLNTIQEVNSYNMTEKSCEDKSEGNENVQYLNVRSWTVKDVGKWLDSISLSQYKSIFSDCSVDGYLLYDLTEYDLLNTMGIQHPLHRKKLLNTIARLRSEEEELILDETKSNISIANRSMLKLTQLTQSTSNFSKRSTNNDKEIIKKFDELIKYIQTGKSAKLKESLIDFPDKTFDPKTIDMQYIPDFGTKYTKDTISSEWNINMTDNDGNTLLHYAAQNGSLLCSQILWNKGANLNHQNVYYYFILLEKWTNCITLCCIKRFLRFSIMAYRSW